MNKFFRRLSSVRLAVALIAYLAVMGVLATLIPQGAPVTEYRDRFPAFAAELILMTGFDRFFTNPVLFWAPALLFFANLSACSTNRFLRQMRTEKSRRRHGPDILHAGLILLALGAVLSFAGYGEGSATLVPGSGARLPDGSTLELLDFRFERYRDGRPKQWTSVVRLTGKDGKILKDAYELKVNSPLRLGRLSLYQASYESEYSLALRDESGNEFVLAPGRERAIEGAAYLFTLTEADAAGRSTLRVTDALGSRTLFVAPGDRIDRMEVVGLRETFKSVIRAVRDPGFLLVLPAMILTALGTGLTFFRKMREEA